VKEQHTDNH